MPLTLYLDTSDYSELSKLNLTPDLDDVRIKLFDLVDSGKIRIAFSFLIIAELLQDFEPEFVESRRRRAQLIKRLCGSNCFPYVSDFWKGRGLSTEGNWMPDGVIDAFSFTSFRKQFRDRLLKFEGLNRSLRRKYANEHALAEYVRSNPNHLKIKPTDDLAKYFPNAFIEGDYFRRYFAREISEAEASEALRKCITDPAHFFELWFVHFENKGVLQGLVEDHVSRLRDGIVQLQKLFFTFEAESKSLQSQAAISKRSYRELKNNFSAMGMKLDLPPPNHAKVATVGDLLISLEKPRELNALPEHSQVLLWEFMKAYMGPRKINNSSIRDMMHAMYIPHCDLWRGDRKFSRLLNDLPISHKSSIVPSLSELPSRIEQLLNDQ
jgi:hypothetical protein